MLDAFDRLHDDQPKGEGILFRVGGCISDALAYKFVGEKGGDIIPEMSEDDKDNVMFWNGCRLQIKRQETLWVSLWVSATTQEIYE